MFRKSMVLGGLLFVVFTVALVGLTGCQATPARGGGGGGSEEPSNDNSEPPDPGADDVIREIEEADIIKYENGYFYLANPFRGLRIIDARSVERPVLAGGYATGGRGIELYVREDRVYLLASADFYYCAGEPVDVDESGLCSNNPLTPWFSGSRLMVFDVSDPTNPELVDAPPIQGYVTATRRVGDVLYVAGSELDHVSTNGIPGIDTNGVLPQDEPAPQLTGNVFVQSFNLTDPNAATSVDYVQIPGTALEIHVSQNAAYVVGDDPSVADTTRVVYVDIQDPAGDIEIRDAFRVPGVIVNRFFMDEYAGVFRIVTQEALQGPEPWDTRERVSIYLYDVMDPDEITRLSRLPIETDQYVTAVRFDGRRAYVMTVYQASDVFVLDLSDPGEPVVAGQIKSLGYSAYLWPMGDRLLTVGYDGRYWYRPTLVLFDVSQLDNPRELSRVSIDAQTNYGVESEANFDEKALKVLEDEQLVLMPFSYFDDETLDFVDALQMVDLLPTRLRERGRIEHPGLIRRAGTLDERLWVLSDVAFQTVDIDDRDDPWRLSTVRIASEQQLLDLGLSNCVDSARFREHHYYGYPDYPYDYYWDYQPVLCGAMGVPALAFTLAGLGFMALRSHRRMG